MNSPARPSFRTEQAAVPEVSLIDGEVIPVRTLFGIGRNYSAHARELGNPTPSEPIVFLKPVSALVSDGATVRLPAESADVQHEVEVVVVLGGSGRRLAVDEAAALIAGYGIGIDITARDLQRRAQSEGNPWTIAKGYDGFAPISDFVPAALVACPGDLAFELSVNGLLRQTGNTRNMLFGFGEIVAFLSRIFTLQRGDLIFTGTPAGVGTINSGDVLKARLPDYQLSVSVVAERMHPDHL